MGLALSVKRGETPRDEVSSEVLGIVDDMSEEEIKKFASTKHKGLPKEKNEEKITEIENKIVSLIKNRKGTMYTKKDILEGNPDVAPARPTTNPDTNPERFNPLNPKYSPKPKARNKGKLPEFLKFKNLNIHFKDE